MHFPLSCISSNDPVEWPLSWQWRGDCTVDRGGRGRIIRKKPRYSPLCAANHSSAVLSKQYQPSWMCQALWGSQWFLSLWSAQRSRAAWKDPKSQSSRMVSPQGWVLWGVRVSFVWEVVFGLSLKWQWGSCWPIYILQRSAFFIVQLSHPYMTTGKTMTLPRQTFFGKVMPLLFNMLSRLVITFLPRNKHVLISWLLSPTEVKYLAHFELGYYFFGYWTVGIPYIFWKLTSYIHGLQMFSSISLVAFTLCWLFFFFFLLVLLSFFRCFLLKYSPTHLILLLLTMLLALYSWTHGSVLVGYTFWGIHPIFGMSLFIIVLMTILFLWHLF